MLEMLASPHFWVDVFKIIVIDILLSGDNAVVIALACRNLPAQQRKQGVMLGVVGAVGLRIVLTFFALELLSLPYLKLIGALLLLWIGIMLILPEKEHDESSVQANTHLWGAVRTIIIADFIMSLDNVLGVAAAAHGNVLLLVFGLLVSIPLIAWSSQLVLKLIDRFPFIIYAGGALLGYVAGEMLLSEGMVAHALEGMPRALHWLLPAVCAVLVLLLGFWLTARMAAAEKAVDLLDEQVSGMSDGKH
ncbi:MAG: YjbE family putative metal transport protein [Sideroxydans sp.]|nr:YjbE family putative metal transport protein [Sideroxydans sp.]